jgi:5-methyltetrahydropteroyltriglutamate--homocysteine methyltransferase
MTQIITTNAGSYPRVGDSSRQQALRRATEKLQRGGITQEEFRAVEDQTVQEVIQEQVEAGIDTVTDGQIRWIDPISHLCRSLTDVEIKGLLRLYDTNFYFRQPVVKGIPKRNGPIFREDFLFAKSKSSRPVRPVLTGPYTLSRLSLAKGITQDQLLQALTELVGLEISELAGAGAQTLQVDEPELLRHPEDLSKFAQVVTALNGQKGKAKLVFHFSFGDITPLFERLSSFPIDILGVDLTYAPKLLASMRTAPRPLQLGVIDARNTKLEDPKAVSEVLRPFLKSYSHAELYLSPSTGLEFLPRQRAFEKLQRLSQVKACLEK